MNTIAFDRKFVVTKTDTNSGSNPLAEAVDALKAGEAGALERLIEKTEKACFHLALSILKDRELAKDALQEAYFTVYRRIHQLREVDAFKSWLFRIVTNACHDILRKRKREFETDLSDQEDLLTTPDNAEELPQREMLRGVFRKLPEIDRQALALREVCSLSYEEMSKVLSVPIGTVRSRLAKARKRFLTAYRKEQQ